MLDENACPTRLLSDEATDSDEFGPHDDLASLLSREIASRSAGSACLVGEWGSGKSSVVKMLEQQLSQTDCDGLVFTFDAWTHQGDPLRKVYLYSLVDALHDRRWISAKLRARTRKLLSGVEKTSMSEQRTVLKPAGAVVLISVAVCAVIGTALATAARFVLPVYYGLFLGLFFGVSLVPLVLAALLYAHLWWKTRQEDDTDDTDEERAEDILAAFLAKPPTKVETRSYDPGQLDTERFERIFRMLLGKAIDGKKRLVLVIDNLDRVPPETARQVWSTIQVFVARDNRAGFTRLPIWVLVPIAESAAESLWSEKDDARAGGRDISHSMLTKTFEIRLDVPQLVRSDFGSYFVARLQEALPKHKEDADAVLRVYESRRTELTWRTPREVKRFLNELTMVHRQQGHAVPLTSQAMYVLARNERGPIEDLILGKNEWAPLLGDPQWRENIAGVAHGVDPRTAIQVLLAPRLAEALADGRLQEIMRFKDVPGYWPMLADVIRQANEVSPLFSVESVVSSYRELLSSPDLQDSSVHGEVNRILALVLQGCSEWRLLEQDGSVIASLVPHSMNPQQLLAKLMTLAASSLALEHGTAAWSACMNNLLRRLPGPIRRAALSQLRFPGDSPTQLNLVADLDQIGRRFLTRERIAELLAQIPDLAVAYRETLSRNGLSSAEPFRASAVVSTGELGQTVVLAILLDWMQMRDESQVRQLSALWPAVALALALGADLVAASEGIRSRGDISYWASVARQVGDTRAEGTVLLLALELARLGHDWNGWPQHGRSAEVFSQLSGTSEIDDVVLADAADLAAKARTLRRPAGPYKDAESKLLRHALQRVNPDALTAMTLLELLVDSGADVCGLMVKSLSRRASIVSRQPYRLSLTSLYASIAQQLQPGRAEDKFSEFIIRSLRSSYSKETWKVALVDDTATVTLLLKYQKMMHGCVSSAFSEAVLDLTLSGATVSPRLAMRELLALALKSSPETTKERVAKAVFEPTGSDWREAGAAVSRLGAHLSSSGFPWTRTSNDVEALAFGLLGTRRATEARELWRLLQMPPLLQRLSKAARTRIIREIRGQLAMRGTKKRRREALTACANLLSSTPIPSNEDDDMPDNSPDAGGLAL